MWLGAGLKDLDSTCMLSLLSFHSPHPVICVPLEMSHRISGSFEVARRFCVCRQHGTSWPALPLSPSPVLTFYLFSGRLSRKALFTHGGSLLPRNVQVPSTLLFSLFLRTYSQHFQVFVGVLVISGGKGNRVMNRGHQFSTLALCLGSPGELSRYWCQAGQSPMEEVGAEASHHSEGYLLYYLHRRFYNASVAYGGREIKMHFYA